MKTCINCGAPLDNDAFFCPNCGKEVESRGTMCPRCGAEVEDGSVFCTKCGMKLYEQSVPPQNPPQVVIPAGLQEEDVVDEWEEENNRKWRFLIGGIIVVVLLTISWYGYNQFNKYTHTDIHELLDILQLPKEYYHSAKDIVDKRDFDLDYYQEGNEYALRARIVYNQKFGNEIRFNNKTFNSDKDDINEFFWVIGHILDCWNTSPAEAVYNTERDGSFDWVAGESTFYYTTTKSRGIQFVVINDYDNEGNLLFQSVDGKYEANFKQVKLNFSNNHSKRSLLLTDGTNQEDKRTKHDSIKEKKKFIWLAYMNAFNDFKDSVGLDDYDDEYYLGGYFMYDITGDGIPELWIIYGTSEAGCEIKVCTYDKDYNYKTIWVSGAGHCGYYEGNGYILQIYAHMGEAFWTKLTYNGKEIVETTIYEEDVNEVDDEGNHIGYRDYQTPTEKYIELNSFNDVEPIKRALELE